MHTSHSPDLPRVDAFIRARHSRPFWRRLVMGVGIVAAAGLWTSVAINAMSSPADVPVQIVDPFAGIPHHSQSEMIDSYSRVTTQNR